MNKQLLKREYYLNKGFIKVYLFVILVSLIGSSIYEVYQDFLFNYDIIYFPLEVISDLGMALTIPSGIIYFSVSLIKDILNKETWSFYPIRKVHFIISKFIISLSLFLVLTMTFMIRLEYIGSATQISIGEMFTNYVLTIFDFTPLIVGSYFFVFVIGSLFVTFRKEGRIRNVIIIGFITVSIQLFLQGLAFQTRSNFNLFNSSDFIDQQVNLIYYFNIYDYIYYIATYLVTYYLSNRLCTKFES